MHGWIFVPPNVSHLVCDRTISMGLLLLHLPARGPAVQGQVCAHHILDSLPWESRKARKKLPAKMRGLQSGSGGEPSMLPSGNSLQAYNGRWRQNLASLSSREHG